MKVGILGAGALGSLLAAYLTRSQAAEAVWLLARSPRPGTVTVDDWMVPVTVVHEPVEPVDLLIVLVKSYDTRAALAWADRAIGQGSILLTLQNGLGNAEVLAERVGPGRVLAGTTALGARLVEPGRVSLGGVGETVIAPWGIAGQDAQVLGVEASGAGAGALADGLETPAEGPGASTARLAAS
ncbi:MAG TPA: 2-dehydropantoate 2-reductase, partial [Symbiobacteriaceae bacterium]|nr:2-dehydropantoate 2-reductase [Symbiobacteriaceae bacterium]